MRTVRHICDKLSDWECMELYVEWLSGESKTVLGRRYKMNNDTVTQTIDRIEAAARGLGLLPRREKETKV